MTSQGLAEYVGVAGGGIAAAGGGIAAAAGGLQRNVMGLVEDRPLVVVGALVAFLMLFWLTRSRAH